MFGMYEAIVAIAGVVIAAVTIARILPKVTSFEQDNYRKRMKLQSDYVKELEEDNQTLKKDVQTAKNTLYRKERGPEYDKDMDWSDLISTFAGDISKFLPKKLQPLFEDKDLQAGLINKIMEHPDKFKPLINKFLKPNNSATQQESNVDAV